MVASKLKKCGVKPGVPDVLIYTPPPKHLGKVGTAVELKRRDGGVVSEFQQEWLADLERHGWLITVAHGWEDAVKFLQEAGY